MYIYMINYTDILGQNSKLSKFWIENTIVNCGNIKQISKENNTTVEKRSYKKNTNKRKTKKKK